LAVGAELDRADVEVISEDFQQTRVERIDYENARLSADYNLLSREFTNVKLERYGRTLANEGVVAMDDFATVLENLMLEVR